jgi:hypothetical protein
MKIITVFLTILILNALGENDQESNMSLTRYILNRMMQAQSRNWCKRFRSEIICNPVFRELALGKSDHDDNFGDFLIQDDDNIVDAINVEFSIWRNPESERWTKILAYNDVEVSLIIRGTEEVKDFETKFEFTYKNGVMRIASDSYTNCKASRAFVISNEVHTIYFCNSNLSYNKFIEEIDGPETSKLYIKEIL